MKLRAIFSGLLILWGAALFAQEPTSELQPRRLELPIVAKSDHHQALPMVEAGVLMIHSVRREGEDQWHLVRYDTSLVRGWERVEALNKNFSIADWQQQGEEIVLLWTREGSRHAEIWRIHGFRGTVSRQEIELPLRYTVQGFGLMGRTAFLSGQYNYKPILHRAPGEGGGVLLPIPFKGKGQITTLVPDAADQRLAVCLREQRGKRSSLYVQTINSQGEVQTDWKVDPQSERNLLNGQATDLGGGELFLVGTYGQRKDLSAQGLFVSAYASGGQQFIRFFDFADLPHFLDHLPSGERERLQSRIDRKQAKGKALDMDLRMLVHPVRRTSTGYLVIAESYYPTYRTEYRTYYYQGSFVNRPIRVFDGWRFSHGVISSFTLKGDLRWANQINLHDARSYLLRPRLRVRAAGDTVELVTASGPRIQRKIIAGEQVQSEQDGFLLPPADSSAQVKWASVLDVQPWFGHYLLGFGVEQVKDEAGRERHFYLSLIDPRAVR